jgi:hypothetical protein
MTVMIKMVIHSSFGIYFLRLILAYRQQIREKSQPTHIVCNRNANLSNKILFAKKFSLIHGIVYPANGKEIYKFTHRKQPVFI